MILVTGGTGFIGKALIRQLVEMGYPVRTLIRPSRKTPDLPRGMPVDVAVSTLTDERSLRAAMVGVDTVYHLAGGEWEGARGNLYRVDILGTRAVIAAALDANIDRFFYVSHLGADRASAYTVLKVKGIAEEFIRRSGLDFTIIRSAIAFGLGDGLTSGLAQLLHALPFFFMLPGNGEVLLQPIWVEDLATCLVWALEDPDTRGRMLEVGGPEYLSFRQIVETVMETLGLRRRLVSMRPAYLRWLTVVLESMFPSLPISTYWLDYLAVNRTCALDTVPRIFNLMPSRFSQRLAYLRGQNWRSSLRRTLMERG